MKQRKLRAVAAGAAAGAVNGLFGAGGGMVLVPLLISFVGLEDRKAFSTAVSIILPLCLVSLAVCWLEGVFPLQDAWPFLLGGLAGGLVGGLLFQNIPVSFLHRIMGILILWGGVKLLL